MNSHQHSTARFRWYNPNGGESIILTCAICHKALSAPLEANLYTDEEIYSMPVLYQIGTRRPFVLYGAPEFIYNEKVKAQRNLKAALSLMTAEQVKAYRALVKEG